MTWDLGRFWNTLTYYEVLPFANFWRWLQNSFPSPAAYFMPPSLTPATSLPLLLLGNGLPEGLAEALRQQGAEVGQSQDGVTARVILGLGDPETAKARLEQLRRSGQTEQLLFDFRQPDPQLNQFWGILDDVVMGGVSQSQLLWGEGELLFTGQVSTANFGGFVSTRTRNWQPPLDASEFAGLELRLRGDGQRYKVLLRDQGGWDSPAYGYAFDTTPGEEQTVQVPFAEMVPTFRARRVAAPPLNTRQIYSLQLMLSKFEADGSPNPRFRPGPFRLGVRWIGLYRQKPLPQLIGVARGSLTPDWVAALQESSSRWCGVEMPAEIEGSTLAAHLLRLLRSPASVGRVVPLEAFHG
ncbi:CIA30 family protein [Synechococcus sp. H65.1]|uniref:CIA30 family protein n=1 Tax=unclassified Synechococcus TaxID=2626047 RepID=UPI0039C2AFE4